MTDILNQQPDHVLLSDEYLEGHRRRFDYTLKHLFIDLPWFDMGAGESAFRLALERSTGLPCDTKSVDLDDAPLSAPDNAYGTVTCFEVVEHLLNPLRAMREAHRILKPGGRLFLTTPNKDSLTYKIKHMLGHTQEGHFHEYRVHELYWLLEKAGFDMISITPFRQSVHGTLARVDKQWLWAEGVKCVL